MRPDEPYSQEDLAHWITRHKEMGKRASEGALAMAAALAASLPVEDYPQSRYRLGRTRAKAKAVAERKRQKLARRRNRR